MPFYYVLASFLYFPCVKNKIFRGGAKIYDEKLAKNTKNQ